MDPFSPSPLENLLTNDRTHASKKNLPSDKKFHETETQDTAGIQFRPSTRFHNSPWIAFNLARAFQTQIWENHVSSSRRSGYEATNDPILADPRLSIGWKARWWWWWWARNEWGWTLADCWTYDFLIFVAIYRNLTPTREPTAKCT